MAPARMMAAALALTLASCGSSGSPEEKRSPTPEEIAGPGFSDVGNALRSADGQAAFGGSPAGAATPAPTAMTPVDPAVPAQLAAPGVDQQQVQALVACRRMQAMRGVPGAQGYDAAHAAAELAADPNALGGCSAGRTP